jgi:hypothetical protein
MSAETQKKSCFECDYSGMDMDMDPYCAHPTLLKDHPYGVVLHSPTVVKYCPAPEHPLWVIRRKHS